MDPLADVIDLARVRGALLSSVRASAPWGLALPQGDGASFHAVTSGTAWMCVAEHEPIQLMPGDLVLLPTGAPHTMSSDLSVDCPPYVKTPGELAIGGTGAVTTLACAGYSYDLEVAPRLMSLLPTVLHVPADPAEGRDVAAIVELLAREVGGRGAGSRTAVARLIDLLLIVAIRAWQPEAPSWLAGLHDPVVARALALLHERPGEAWTLEKLAREVGLSRSALAERFTHFVGEPPVQYLTRWRMQVAARLLADGHAKVATIALQVGYDSEAAFSRAFKKLAGVPPAAWRRRHASPPAH